MGKSETLFLYQITQPVNKFHTFTNTTEPFLVTSSAASYPFICILWSPKVQYHLHNSPPFFLILNHTNPIHALPFYIFKIHFNIILLYSPSLSRGLRLQISPPNSSMHLSFPHMYHMPRPFIVLLLVHYAIFCSILYIALLGSK